MLFINPTFLVTALNVVIVALIGATVYFTNDAMAILALLLLRETPIITANQELMSAFGEMMDGDQEGGEYDGEGTSFDKHELRRVA